MKYILMRDFSPVVSGSERKIKKHLTKNNLMRCVLLWSEMKKNVSVGLDGSLFWLRKENDSHS
jgi:hypothetical protein